MTDSEAPRPDQQPPQPQQPSPEGQAPVPPAAPQPPEAAPQPPEAAPTDLRRNIWLLVIILGVVVLAWAVSLLMPKPAPSPESAVGPQAGASTPPGQTASAGPDEPDAPSVEPVMPMGVIASERFLIAASPLQVLDQEKGTFRMPLLFDVTQRAKTFDIRGLMHLSGRWAGQKVSLALAGRAEEFFQPAVTVPSLQDQDRMVVVSVGTEVHAYPADLLAAVTGVTDVVGGRRVFVTWSPVTQLARCLAAQIDEKPVDWEDAGLVYRGNEVLFDRGTGSLWDAVTGAAVSGPMVDKAVGVLPVQVWLWGQWKATHPESSVLNPPGVTLDKDVGKRIDAYLASPAVPVPLAHFGSGPTVGSAPSPLSPKAFVLGLAADGQSRAYDLGALFKAGQTSLKDTVGKQDFEITVTSPRTATATSAGAPADALVMLWFGWKEVHPETTVYGAPRPAQPVGEVQPAPATPPPAPAPAPAR